MPGSVDINPSADCEKDVTVSKEPKSIATTTVEIQDDFDLILNLEVNDKGVYICKGRLQGFYPIYLLQDSVLRSKKLGNQPGSPKPGPLPRDKTEKYFPFEVKGTDYESPIYYKTNKKSELKTYILLLSCSVTREPYT